MKLIALLIIPGIFLLQVSCSRTGGIPPPPPPDPCSLISINLSGGVTNPTQAGASDGTIAVTASGAGECNFSLNGGPFQQSGHFYNLSAGNYVVVAKNGDGCTGTVNFQLINPVISCAGVNIIVSTVQTTNTLCESPNATLTVSATGGTAPYSYSLDGGAFQAINVYGNLPTASYMITVKDANGCTGTASTTVSNAPAGPLYAKVKALVMTHCIYCHGSAAPAGGVSYSSDCNIINGQLRLKARAVDGNPSPMPVTGLLPVIERQKIIDWINAGGRYRD